MGYKIWVLRRAGRQGNLGAAYLSMTCEVLALKCSLRVSFEVLNITRS